jgi:hypothetical protein
MKTTSVYVTAYKTFLISEMYMFNIGINWTNTSTRLTIKL